MPLSGLPPLSGRTLSNLGPSLAAADRAGNRLDAALRCLPTPKGFEEMQNRREAVASVRLDGHQLELVDLVGRVSPHEAGSAVSVARCCVAALTEDSRSLTAEEDPLSPARLSRIHGLLIGSDKPPGVLPGSARGIKQLDRYLSRSARAPGVLRAAVLQARLHQLTIFDPQPDRFARIVGLGGLLWTAVPGGRAIALSEAVLSRIDEYRYRQTTLVSGTDWNGWLEFFVECFVQAAADSEVALSRFAALREEHRMIVAEALGHSAFRGLKLLDRLAQAPVVTVADVREVTGTSYVAANQLVARLVDLGILEEVTGFKRNRHFLYGACLIPFADSAREDEAPVALAIAAQEAPEDWAPEPAPPEVELLSPSPAPSAAKAGLADHLL